MDIYNVVARQAARLMTERYSTSFSLASRLFDSSIRADIYNIYGLVRLADEIVDTYRGSDAQTILDALETDTYASMDRQYSSNIIVQAFVTTARQVGIKKDLIQPFFTSMRADLSPVNFDRKQYDTYIYGSAEVVGLMCLRVFVQGDTAKYDGLASGASQLGAAYQKVNFIRDFASDSRELQRHYFPDVSSNQLTEAEKQVICTEIQTNFMAAKPYVLLLPRTARAAVQASFRYYGALLRKVEQTPAATISQKRIRIPNSQKLLVLGLGAVNQRIGRR